MAAEILANLEDINTHLPDDKAKMQDSEDDTLQIDAARYVRSLLAGFFSPATLLAWNTPATTPELIRGIAGRIIAAKYYARLYSEDIPEISAYAQSLYNEANFMIDEIRTGKRVVLDAADNPIPTQVGIALSDADFWPNATTVGPFFTMDKVLG